MLDRKNLEKRILELTGWSRPGRMAIINDTSDPMAMQRGDILCLGDRDYLIKGNRYETRFGIGDQPKYWVFGAIDLESGQQKILKTVFQEEFHVHIGVFKIHCYRSPDKESQILELTRGDDRFMQGFTVYDEKGSNVRVLDLIRGETLFRNIYDLTLSHRDFFETELGPTLKKLLRCFEAIQLLHRHGTCHGDIRNDHIIIDSGTGDYRWIDFDLNQHVSDFDVWSLGNIINYVSGQGINSFHEIIRSRKFSDDTKNSLRPEDGSAFYEYRVMNLGKLYPYLPQRLQKILAHFTVKPTSYYEKVDQLLDDYNEMLDKDF